MKRLVVVPAVLLVVAAVPFAVSAPAHAKGATDVVVAGPGIEDERLTYTRPRSDVDLGSLSEATGIYGIFGAGQLGTRPSLTAGELGPRFDLTWYIAGRVLVRSHVYPFAEGGAWAEVPQSQELRDPAMATGWWHGGAELERQLVELGAVTAAIDLGAAPDQVTTEPPVTEFAADASSPPAKTGTTVAPYAAGVAGAALLCGAAWWLRRRRTPQPVLTLSEPA